MLDLSLASRLLDALPERCVVLFVGDADQLPSVGPGAVLGDLLSSPRVPRVELDRIFRQVTPARRAPSRANGPVPARPGGVARVRLAAAYPPAALQDPAGDIARNAALVNSGAVPRHLRRLEPTHLRSFVASP